MHTIKFKQRFRKTIIITNNIHFSIEEEEIEFSAIGTGSSGERINYHFVLEFFLPIQKDSGKGKNYFCIPKSFNTCV